MPDLSDHGLLIVSTFCEILILLFVMYEAYTTFDDRRKRRQAPNGPRRVGFLIVGSLFVVATAAWFVIYAHEAASSRPAANAAMLVVVLSALGAGSRVVWEHFRPAVRIEPPCKLSLLFEERGPYVHDDFDPSVGSRRRIGVKNQTDQAIDGVIVYLDSFSPQGADFLPIRLRRLHGESQPFTLTPRSEAHIEVAAYSAMGEFPDHIALQYDSGSAPQLIPIAKCPYTLTIHAVSRDSLPCITQFALSVAADGRLLFAVGKAPADWPVPSAAVPTASAHAAPQSVAPQRSRQDEMADRKMREIKAARPGLPHPPASAARLTFLPPKIVETGPLGPGPLDLPMRLFLLTVPVKNEADSPTTNVKVRLTVTEPPQHAQERIVVDGYALNGGDHVDAKVCRYQMAKGGRPKAISFDSRGDLTRDDAATRYVVRLDATCAQGPPVSRNYVIDIGPNGELTVGEAGPMAAGPVVGSQAKPDAPSATSSPPAKPCPLKDNQLRYGDLIWEQRPDDVVTGPYCPDDGMELVYGGPLGVVQRELRDDDLIGLVSANGGSLHCVECGKDRILPPAGLTSIFDLTAQMRPQRVADARAEVRRRFEARRRIGRLS